MRRAVFASSSVRTHFAPHRILLSQEDGSWIQFDDDKMIPRKEEEVLTLCGEAKMLEICCSVVLAGALPACLGLTLCGERNC